MFGGGGGDFCESREKLQFEIVEKIVILLNHVFKLFRTHGVKSFSEISSILSVKITNQIIE